MEYMINSMWVLIAGALVFFMQTGFGLLETGLARQKNMINILMKNLMGFNAIPEEKIRPGCKRIGEILSKNISCIN